MEKRRACSRELPRLPALTQHSMAILKAMSGAHFNKMSPSTPVSQRLPLNKSSYVATAAEAIKNYQANEVRTWYKDGADPEDPAGKYAFQRLRQTWFTPKVDPKLTLRRDDKFYAFDSCFARGIEHSLTRLNIAVETAAPEFAKHGLCITSSTAVSDRASSAPTDGYSKSEPTCAETP